MAICPATLKPCIDDLCYGGGCFRLGGESLLTRCECGALIAIDGSQTDDCTCDPDERYEEMPLAPDAPPG